MAPYNMPQDAVWFITGCSSGIGLHLCQHLAANTSCRVVATARNPDSLSAIPDGPNVLKITLDVTSESSIQAALTQTLKTWSRIDIVVNNAGYGMHADTETASLTKARNLMDTNFWAAVRITQLALPILRDENPKSGQRGGAILQITSLGGRHGFPGGAFYHASKFALEGFSEALYKELPDEWNIHVSCIEPGGVKTNYASTATANRDAQTAKHPAYTDPNMPANVLRTYQTSPEATKNWAEPEKVVQVMYEVVKEGGEIPVRLPLGSDSWGMQVQGAKTALEFLEKVKSVSLSTSGEEQLESIGFLKA